MRYLYYFCLISLNIISQEAVQATLLHDDLEREYILYIPNSYDGQEPFPLVLNLHGYTSNGGEQMIYSNLFEAADTANFLIVHPTGTLNTINEEFWNSGEIFEVDDIGFLSQLIDYLVLNYNIDSNRVYSTGFSNGGFMSYTLACELSDKIAAIASVTGSMTPETYSSCSPNHPTPILQIHGLRDAVVPYNGLSYIESIPKVMQYWSEYNSCDLEPEILVVDNFDDDYSVNFETYINCLNNINIKLILHSAMGHTWPMRNNYGVSASNEIWDFVSQYDIYGKIN